MAYRMNCDGIQKPSGPSLSLTAFIFHIVELLHIYKIPIFTIIYAIYSTCVLTWECNVSSISIIHRNDGSLLFYETWKWNWIISSFFGSSSILRNMKMELNNFFFFRKFYRSLTGGSTLETLPHIFFFHPRLPPLRLRSLPKNMD